MIRPICLLLMLTGCDKLLVSDTDVLPLYDQDGDGFYAPESSAVGEAGPYDCDDGNEAVHPDAVESCNGRDDDCNGVTDDGDDRKPWYLDADQDGYGDGAQTRQQCDQPAGYVALDGDCDDSNAAVRPGVTEICDGLDDDCDGKVDAADADLEGGTTYYADADGDDYGDPAVTVYDCDRPADFVDAAGDCDDAAGGVHPGATEVCNNLDDDCDGKVDIDDADVADAGTWYPDVDGDGYGDESSPIRACSQPSGTVTDGTDCDDAEAASHPGASESCTGKDWDCDGQTYESDSIDAVPVYSDADGDGYGGMASGTACPDHASAGLVFNEDDCDDTTSTVHPAATEYCADGADDDCNSAAGPCAYAGGLYDDSLSTPTTYGGTAHTVARVETSYSSSFVYGSPTSITIADYSGTYEASWTYMYHGPAPFPSPPAYTLQDATIAPFEGYGLLVEAPYATASSTNDGEIFVLSSVFYGGDLATSAYATYTNVDGRYTIYGLDQTYGTDGFLLVSTSSSVVGVEYAVSAGTSVLSLDATITSISSADDLGTSVGALGDVDGDGTTDIVVGAPGVGSGTGAVYVMLSQITGDLAPTDLDLTVSGSSNSQFGQSSTNEFDVDSDGYDDLLVGAPYDDTSGIKNAGAAYLFLGPLSASTTYASADATILGTSVDEQVGVTVAASDLDEDGFPEIFAGAPNGTNGALFGTPFTFGSSAVSAAEFEFDGVGDGAYVAYPGDFDLDGRDDLMILGGYSYFWMHAEL